MVVYQLRRCEEYWMQETHGLFKERQSAVDYVTNVLLRVERNSTTFLVSSEDGQVEVKDRTGIPVTEQNFNDYLKGYSFYGITHAGYHLWGIYEETVRED